MSRVFKYTLKTSPGTHELRLPIGARFLSIQVVEGKPVAYFQVSDHLAENEHTFSYEAVWTGSYTDITMTHDYMGTAVLNLMVGIRVIHYFEL